LIATAVLRTHSSEKFRFLIGRAQDLISMQFKATLRGCAQAADRLA
jgi:hypothetical protein